MWIYIVIVEAYILVLEWFLSIFSKGEMQWDLIWIKGEMLVYQSCYFSWVIFLIVELDEAALIAHFMLWIMDLGEAEIVHSLFYWSYDSSYR